MASRRDATTWRSTNEHLPKTNWKLQKNHSSETGKQIQYDIQELRQGPKRISRWIEQREKPVEWQEQEKATTMWGKLKKQYARDLPNVTQ